MTGMFVSQTPMGRSSGEKDSVLSKLEGSKFYPKDPKKSPIRLGIPGLFIFF